MNMQGLEDSMIRQQHDEESAPNHGNRQVMVDVEEADLPHVPFQNHDELHQPLLVWLTAAT